MFSIVQRDSDLCPDNPWAPEANYEFTTEDDLYESYIEDVRYITEVTNV